MFVEVLDSFSTVTLPSGCWTVVSVFTEVPPGPCVVLDVVSTVRSQEEKRGGAGIDTSGGAGNAPTRHKECQQFGVELVFVGVGQAVGSAGIDLQGGVSDQLG